MCKPKDADREIVATHQERLRESIRFFSNDLKPERERWVCREFLENYHIDAPDSELVTSPNDPPDVLYEDARFEVKELLDEGRHRGTEFRDALARAEKATDASKLLEPYEPKTMEASAVQRLVAAEVESLQRKYPAEVRRELDLLFYANLLDYATVGDSINTEPPIPALVEWRSVAFVSNNCSCVMWASSEAPEFLRERVGRVAHKDPQTL